MPRLAKPKTDGVKVNDLKKKLGVDATVVDDQPAAPRRGRKPKAVEPAEEKAAEVTKVTPIRSKAKGKAPVATAPAAPVEPPKTRGKAGKVAPTVPVIDDEENLGESESISWDKLFPPVIEGQKFRYVRQNSDKVTLADLQKHLPKFDTYVLMAEQRKQDEQFTKLVMCFISKETITFIDQTGGEDFDSIVQVAHDEVIGQKEFHVKKSTFPFAIYFKEVKRQ